MTNSFLEDAKGNKSSKRLWGSIILGIGTLFSVVLFVYSLSKGAADALKTQKRRGKASQ